MKTSTFAPFAKPLYVMVKPVGAVCNLACDYCYYLEKANLYKDNPKHVMSDELLEKFIDEYINSQTMPQVLFTWHGGETLMRPLSFYKKAMELQKKYARGRTIDNCIQTNGTMLTDEWCEFFRENNWLVGVSIDGPQEFHDEYRKNKLGKPSFVKVMQGINLLKKHGVNGMQWQLSMTSMPNIRWSFIVSSKKSVVSISNSLPSLNVFFHMKTDVISLLLPKIKPEHWLTFQSLRNNGGTSSVLSLTNG